MIFEPFFPFQMANLKISFNTKFREPDLRKNISEMDFSIKNLLVRIVAKMEKLH